MTPLAVLRGLYSQAAVGVTIFLMVLAAAANEACQARWNCPCAGGTKRHYSKRAYLFTNRGYNSGYGLTAQLVRKMVEERFLNNTEHAAALRACALTRDPVCLSIHLQGCDLDLLPRIRERLLLSDLQDSRLSEREVLIQARQLLTRLAIFIAQARRDEHARLRTTGRSFLRDVMAVEERGIYDLLCALHRTFISRPDLTWRPLGGHVTGRPGGGGGGGVGDRAAATVPAARCHLRHTAPRDNRNYIVLHTLQRALNNIAVNMRRLQQIGRRR